ncbi:hypothetical protein [Thalassotalea crassostreae]|uniref:hypothetical protein n=1 Tax=Thalassotalea crassostreae TaxID=1763536 RepID=UPI000837C855|nr:hypothetical protein [Thalassotalea crassostreae]
MNKLIALLLVSFFSTHAFATTIQECAAIDEDKQRLSCYDDMAKAIVETDTNKERTSEVKPLILSSAPVEDEIINQPVLPTVKEKSEEEQVQQVEANFGLKQKKVKTIEETHLIIKSSKLSKHGKWTIKFENGQIWTTLSSERMKFKVGQKVKISRGVFNSFILSVENQNRTVKVKRIK